MQEISQRILSDYQVRKTKTQKLQFIEFLRGYMPELTVEEGGFLHNRNIVVGDVSRAKVVVTAHYDTCAVLPFPNFIMPKNILLSLLYSFLIVIPFFAVMVAVQVLLRFITDNFFVLYWSGLAIMLLLIILVFFAGKPNKHTANDNTSGVISLCELMDALPQELKDKVAFVFFDNEENGLLGSAFFRKKHKKEMPDKLLINLDCVSDGDHIMMVLNRAAEKAFGAAIAESFQSGEGKEVHIEKTANTFYPSDQQGFPLAVGMAALRKHRLFGLYMGRIHTPRDTVFDEGNIRFICERLVKLIGNLT